MSDPTPDRRYHGFTLNSVCWGYREVFRESIEALFREGAIGPERREVTAKFFEMLRCSTQGGFDHVVREFLGALNPRMRWVLDLPEIFADMVDLGGQLATRRAWFGMRFFDAFGRGGCGTSPDEVRHLMAIIRRLRVVEDQLAIAFLQSYAYLLTRLTPKEIDRYVQAGIEVFARNSDAGLKFMEGTLRTSEVYVRSISRECRLDDVKEPMTALLRALSGTEAEISDLGSLDSDDLMERGSTVVCLGPHLYLPQRVRDFETAEANRRYYLLATLVAAGMLLDKSFPVIHGHPRYRTCEVLAGKEPDRVNLFQIVEYVRVLRRIRRRWPGARRLLAFGLSFEFNRRAPSGDAERLFAEAVGDTPSPEALYVRRMADQSANCFDTAERLMAETWWPACGGKLGPFTFLPDFMFPASFTILPDDRLVATLREEAGRRDIRRPPQASDRAVRTSATVEEATAPSSDDALEAAEAAYTYDEWCREAQDYYRDYCRVHEQRVTGSSSVTTVPDDIMDAGRRVKSVFERFKPALTRREKYLSDGEVINIDLLVEYLADRQKEPHPRIRFYERPRINRRDLVVLVLLDASGSTNDPVGSERKVIEVEKHAASILGQGLHVLGDRFAICGFNSNGPERCSYYVYKDFDQAWDRRALQSVLSATPSGATRIGPALRHSGYRLRRIAARQKLILVITDGRPMDSNYDPQTQHAQYDVRMANEENARAGIHTFGISTEENSVADMEIMFPHRRFAILPDIRHLLSVLPKAYIRLTT